MANRVFPLTCTAILKADADFDVMDCRVIPIDTASYTYNAAHDMLDDVAGGSRKATAVALASETVGVVAAGVFDAADTTLTGVTGTVNMLLIYDHTGTESTSKLIAMWDTGVTGLPTTLSGGTITVAWNAGGIIALS